jgi:UDP-glucose 4-epimerase
MEGVEMSGRDGVKLVTGGAGFVGSFLATRLLEMGHEVRVFDVERTEYLPRGAEFVMGDMRDYCAVRESLRGVDTVHHLAFVQVFSRRPEPERWAINYGGTENFLRASVEESVRRFVHASTIEIYSPFPPYPVTEESPTDRPMGWYGRHKKACEELCLRYYRDHGLPVTMLRIPTICGRGYYARVDMLRGFDWIIANGPLFWIGGRQYKGDFVWVEDVVDAFILAAGTDEAVGEAFNISCSEANTSLEIMQAIMDAAGNTRGIHLVPPWIAWPVVKLACRLNVIDMPSEQLQYLMSDYHFSIDKAGYLLGYQPKMNAAEAAAELMLGYMEDRKKLRRKAATY